MATTPTFERMPDEQAAALTEFARTCRAAARSVSLYPATHPAILAALSRVGAAATRLAPSGEVTLIVHPDALAIDGCAPERPDPAIGEFARLLHDRLIGALRIEHAADPTDWRTFLLLLARTPEELMTDGGIAAAWAATGRAHFEVREIDYAEVLRERAGVDDATWERIVAFCLRGGETMLDDAALQGLIEAILDSERLRALIAAIQINEPGGATAGARTAALLSLLKSVTAALTPHRADEAAAVLDTVARAVPQMTPEMLLAMIQQGRTGSAEDAALVAGIATRIDDHAVASLVATSVAAERGATERLAQVFEALVPDEGRKERLLDLAKHEIDSGPLADDEGLEQLWQGAASMLMSYSDKDSVSDAYARELSGARAQAIEVERVSDDPPARIEGWVSSVSDQALRELDLALVLDLLRIAETPNAWGDLSAIVVVEIERRTDRGDADAAQHLLDALVQERSEGGRAELRPLAQAALDTVAGGPAVRHVVRWLGTADDAAVERWNRVCHALGPATVRSLAEALAVEGNSRTIRRLRDLLLSFGASGRETVEQLKHSANPAVRRTAIDLLRVFGGQDALSELTSMLGDADPQVQRESIRAILQIGTDAAYGVLKSALVADAASGAAVLHQLIGLRDDKAVPLLCHVLDQTQPRGALVGVHVEILEALGGLSQSPEALRTLRGVLHGGDWWAPLRTAALRQVAAAALRRLGSKEALAALQEAAASGSRGTRKAARLHLTPERQAAS